MLVLTREVDEIVLIGDDISVAVLHISGTQVRLGIRAPQHVSIDRGEVRKRKLREGERPPACTGWAHD